MEIEREREPAETVAVKVAAEGAAEGRGCGCSSIASRRISDRQLAMVDGFYRLSVADGSCWVPGF